MKKLVLISLLFLYGINAITNEVPIKIAKNVAKNFYWEYAEMTNNIINNEKILLDLVYIESEENLNLFYVFQINQNKGWVLVSANDKVKPILGFSFSGTYSENNRPPALISLIEEYKEQIKYIIKNNISAGPEIINEWSYYASKNFLSIKNVKYVGPLVSTQWNQDCYYNANCPYDVAAGPGLCYHCPTGCVATAMAQIMKYWNHPQQGNGSHGYNSDYGYEYANFGNTTYNWASMPNSVNSSNSSVAELMYHCGVSVEMDYGPTSSSASTSDVEDALEDYFYYSTSADVKDRTWYSTSAWKNMIINEIDNNRPMQYRGANYWNNGGHSFICDGYLGDYFHFNWGWGGSYDGWFDIDDLEPGGYNFKYNHKMIIGIEPIPTPPPAPSWLIAQTLSSTSINITYENVVNEDGYEVYYSTSPSGSYTSIGTVGANSCYVDITGLNPNTQYCFKVKAYNSAGSSCFSPYDCDITDDIPPSAPSSLTATTASSSQINVAWSNVSNEDGYKIYRATSSGGSYSQIGTTGANVTSYPDNGLPSNTEYCYKVKAYNSAGNSGFSPYDCATTNDPTNISDVILNKIIKIYPNPAKDILYIETTGSGLFIKNIEIFSGIGKSVYRSDFDNTNNLIKIPLTNFHPGIYFIKTQTNNGIITRKIIIQH